MNVAHINRIISTTPKVNVDSIETYSNEYHAADFGDNDQINKQATVELIADSASSIFNGDIIEIPAGTSIPSEYFDIDYTPYFAGHGPNPGVFVLKIISPSENQIIYDVPVSSINDGSQLITLRVYPHIDPTDPTLTADDIIILIK